MTYGITGNPTNASAWEPLEVLLAWMDERKIPVSIHEDLVAGLGKHQPSTAPDLQARATADPVEGADVLLSFGGDGSLLRSAHLVGTRPVPILGVNVGRLGFLTRVEAHDVIEAVKNIEAGTSKIEEWMALEVRVRGTNADLSTLYPWALNDVVVDKSGTTSMIQVEALVDGTFLNTYWADGLIVSTPTGSTAYSLSAGGPIISPDAQNVVITPIAPHMLTARPIVLPASCEIELRVVTRRYPYLLAVDGRSVEINDPDAVIRVRRAAHAVRLVTLPDSDYFATIREKLSWGQSRVF